MGMGEWDDGMITYFSVVASPDKLALLDFQENRNFCDRQLTIFSAYCVSN